MRMRGDLSDCILKMRNLRFEAHFPLHGDHIDLPVIDGMFRRVVPGAGKHVRLLSRSDILLREKVLARSKCLYFHENRDVALFCDDIDFAVRRARVPGENWIAASRQIRCDRILTPLADRLIVLRHFRNSSRTDINHSPGPRFRGLVF